MKKSLLLALLVFSFVFTACGSKRVYEPTVDTKLWKHNGDIQDEIIDITATGALLDDRTVLSKNGHLNVSINEEHTMLGIQDGWLITATLDGKLKLQYLDDKIIVETLDLKKTIAAVGVKDDIIAVIFADNEIALYSMSSKKAIFKDRTGDVSAVDSRITPPFFTRGIVIFPTLNGKVIIVNTQTNKKLRTVRVSSEENFNNVLFLDIIDSKVVAATTHKILAMSQEESRQKYDIRNVAKYDTKIYVTTKQGDVVLLNSALKEHAKIKFPFAHFLGAIATENHIYLLEKEGYMIVASYDLSSYDVYDVDIDDGSVFVSDNKFFINDEYISIQE